MEKYQKNSSLSPIVIGKKTAIILCFRLRDKDGNILDDIYANSPRRCVFDKCNLPHGFMEEIKGLKPGAKKNFVLPKEKGYGKRKKELIVKIHKKELLEHEKYKVGQSFCRFDNHLNRQTFVVTGYIGDWIFLDGNHPYAGKSLYYEVHIIDVQPA